MPHAYGRPILPIFPALLDQELDGWTESISQFNSKTTDPLRPRNLSAFLHRGGGSHAYGRPILPIFPALLDQELDGWTESIGQIHSNLNN